MTVNHLFHYKTLWTLVIKDLVMLRNQV